MGRLHLSIVFPAVLVSCSVFSSLTLPFILSDPPPFSIKLAPLLDGEFKPVFQRENKGLAIRYIGAAIVLSVGSGLFTIELLRRLQSAIEQPQQRAAANQQLFAGDEQASLNTFFTDLDGGFEPDLEFLSASHPEVAEAVALSSVPILHHPETCRIRIENSDHTQLAVMWQGGYYCFFRVRDTETEALAIAQRLIERGEEVVVAQLDQGFSVWVKGAESSVKLVSS
ncbi:MAG: hypothetical protein Kow00121_25900 [Elainellaceae cyanobacterium]